MCSLRASSDARRRAISGRPPVFPLRRSTPSPRDPEIPSALAHRAKERAPSGTNPAPCPPRPERHPEGRPSDRASKRSKRLVSYRFRGKPANGLELTKSGRARALAFLSLGPLPACARLARPGRALLGRLFKARWRGEPSHPRPGKASDRHLQPTDSVVIKDDCSCPAALRSRMPHGIREPPVLRWGAHFGGPRPPERALSAPLPRPRPSL